MDLEVWRLAWQARHDPGHGFSWIYMDLYGFQWFFMDLGGFHGFQGSGCPQPVPPRCIEIPGYAAPSEESLLGILRLGSFEAWKLGLEAWKLGSLLDTSMDSSIG